MNKTIKVKLLVQYIAFLFLFSILAVAHERVVFWNGIGIKSSQVQIQERKTEAQEVSSPWTVTINGKYYSIVLDSSVYLEFASWIIIGQIILTVIFFLSDMVRKYITSRFSGSKSPKVYQRTGESAIKKLIAFEDGEDWCIDFEDNTDMADSFERTSKSSTAKFTRGIGTNRFTPIWICS